MFETVWHVNDRGFVTELTWYHFGREPKFPSWYMQEGIDYKVEVVRHTKLAGTPKSFKKCLFHEYTLR